MKHKFNQTCSEHIYNYLINFFKRKFTKNRCFRSLLTSLYVTLKCNLHCKYCYYHKLNQKELDTKEMFKLLEKIRPKNPALNITGGEPLVRKDIIDILKKAKELKFAPIILNTNALILDKKEECLNYVDYVIVSLDTLNLRKFDSIAGIKGVSKKIIENILKYKKLENKFGFRLKINCVITPQTIRDVYKVIEFCHKYDISIGVVPQDNGTIPEPELTKSKDYKKLIKDIIRLRKKGYKVGASERFLKQILNFKPHNCFPTLVPRIYPDGSVFYPCQPLKKIYGNLLNYPDLYTLIKEVYKKQGLPSCCFNSKKCFLSCYMEFVNPLEHPLSLFRLNTLSK